MRISVQSGRESNLELMRGPWLTLYEERAMPIELPYVIDSDAPHLGGNLRHGDLGSFTPKTWAWVARRFAINSMLDIGCGEGHAVAYFHSIGVFSHGIDGLHANIKRSVTPIALHDLCYS